MGQHLVDQSALDGKVSLGHPEALVYEVKPGNPLRQPGNRLRLVAVEYIVPSSFVNPKHPPRLLGQNFHLNSDLDVWVLHAWVWKYNPAGVFADWNPRVGACPPVT